MQDRGQEPRSIDGYTAEPGTARGIDVTPPDAQNGIWTYTDVSLARGDTYDVTAFKPKEQIAVGPYKSGPMRFTWTFGAISRRTLRWVELNLSKVIWRRKP